MNEYVEEMVRLMGGTGRLKLMLGAKDFVYSNEEMYFAFKFPNKDVNYFKITYNYGMDLYNLEFGYIRGTTYRVIKELEEIYAEDVKEIFERTTGLYLSLF